MVSDTQTSGFWCLKLNVLNVYIHRRNESWFFLLELLIVFGWINASICGSLQEHLQKCKVNWKAKPHNFYNGTHFHVIFRVIRVICQWNNCSPCHSLHFLFLYFSRAVSQCHVGSTLAIMSQQSSPMEAMFPTQTHQLLQMTRHHLMNLNILFTLWHRYRQQRNHCPVCLLLLSLLSSVIT